MKPKHLLLGLLNVILLAWGAWSSPAAEPLRFFFTGQITERRSLHSVFAGGVGDPFSGYFSFDSTAVDLDPGGSIGYYPLPEFSVDGILPDFLRGI
jgi:hypothetical protein